MHIIVRGRSTPTTKAEKQEQAKNALRASGWDGDRAREHLRKNLREDKHGRKFLDLK